MPYGKEDIQYLNIIHSLKSILERFENSKSKGELKENLKDLIDIYDLWLIFEGFDLYGYNKR